MPGVGHGARETTHRIRKKRYTTSMGIYDREYYREQRPGLSLSTPRTMVTTLIIINVVLYLADGLLTAQTHSITYTLAAKPSSLTNPLQWWQLITYGFAHAPSPSHILFNMLTLWFLGRDVEAVYGRYEFLRLYLVMLLTGSVAWTAIANLEGATDVASVMFGASGAVAGVVVLFALHFPKRTLLLFFVLPVPAWLVGVLVVVSDMLGATGRAGASNVAYTVHLAGAAMAFLYYQFGLNFGRLLGGDWLSKLKPGPRLRVHQPDDDQGKGDRDSREDDLSAEVDRILQKIHTQGESSLSRKERKTLEEASRRYQRRRGE